MPIEQEVLARYLNPVFVETGTFQGNTVEKALAAGFRKVHTIEIDPELVAAARARFAGDERVVVHEGDTLDRLPEILDGLEGPATFWLDAHRSGPFAGGNEPFPILGELKQLARHPVKTHTILIDDRRLIESDWGMKEKKIHKALKKINKAYQISYEPGHVPDDIIVARL